MRAVACRRWVLAAVCILLVGHQAHVSSAAVVRDLPPDAARPSSNRSTSRIGLPGDPGLPNGSIGVTSAVPRRAAQARSGAGALQATSADVPIDPQPALRPTFPTRDAYLNGDAGIGPVPQVIDVAPVPEPSTALLLGAAAVAALARRGRRRTRAAHHPR